jgi:pSer/pThr/pTyr-binding forkhead associated (FHA) protein
MVASTVTFTVTGGSHSGKQFVFSVPANCVAGRASDCCVRLAGAFEDCMLSRHHCAIDVNPPEVRVRDLGSRNGTFLNGHRIGGRALPLPPAKDTQVDASAYPLKDGDELRLGPIPLRVTIRPKELPPG